MLINNSSIPKENTNPYASKINSTKLNTPRIKETLGESSHQDKVSISSEAKNLLAEMNDLESTNLGESPTKEESSMSDILEDVRNQASEKDDSSNELYKCLIIAMRIMGGHKVPPKDEQFLAVKQPDLYLRAVLLRKDNKDSKEYEGLIKEEKETNPLENLSPSDSEPVGEAINELLDQ